MKKTLITWLLLSAGLLASGQEKPEFPGVDLSETSFNGISFRSPGPTRGGRVTAVAGIPEKTGTFYMGASGGGVWKTEDFGNSWFNVSDGFFETPSIGAIRVAPGHTETVWVGTGSDGVRSNIIIGKGVYKSTDGGKTWKHAGLRNAGQIGAVEIHPDNPDVVFVAAIGNPFGPNPERGVFRTTDGGKSWEKVLYISDITGATDLEFCPENPQIIYASVWHVDRKPWTIVSGNQEGGIFKSADGGNTWKKLTKGLPAGIFGKSDLGVSPADPGRLYALVEAADSGNGLYRSDDQGESFVRVSAQANLLDRPFYYCNVDADPTNADVLYVNTTGFFKSTDGGKSWERKRTPHGDNHDMWINPLHPEIFIQANDGGANITLDGGISWSSQHNQPTAELYQVEVDDQFPYWLYAGQQDNTTIALPSLPPYRAPAGPSALWMDVGGCETGPAVPKPGDPDIVYSNCKGRFGVYNKRTGQEKQYYVGAANMYGHNPKDLKYRFQRVAPIHVSPHNPGIVYHASQYLHRTTDEGVTWETISPDLTAFEPDKQVISGSPITRDITGEEFYSTIYSVRESPLEPGVIWTGANDGPVYVTRNHGQSWENVTPPDLPPGGRVDAVELSHHQKGRAYIAVLRYQLNDWSPYIYRTDDYGRNWTLLTDGRNGIPADFPIRVVREDPQSENLLFAGTEFGLFVSTDRGASWSLFQLNLPVTPVTDIKIKDNDLVLSTMGRGFWILDEMGFLRQLPAKEKLQLFDPVVTYRMRSYGSIPGSVPYYPQPGMVIDYYLEDEIVEALTMEISDMEGKLVRVYNLKERLPGSMQAGTAAGYHRLVWDLRMDWKGEPGNGYRRARGPMVVPGTYAIRLSSGNKSQEVKAELQADPRIIDNELTISDLQEQFELSVKVADLYLRAQNLGAELKRTRESLKPLKAKDKTRIARMKEIEAQLLTPEGIYMTPMLLDQISYLYYMLDAADQKPGKDAYERFEELESRLRELEERWSD